MMREISRGSENLGMHSAAKRALTRLKAHAFGHHDLGNNVNEL